MPTIKAKEVESVTLLRRRPNFARLDYGPFMFAYVVLANKSIVHWVQDQR